MLSYLNIEWSQEAGRVLDSGVSVESSVSVELAVLGEWLKVEDNTYDAISKQVTMVPKHSGEKERQLLVLVSHEIFSLSSFILYLFRIETHFVSMGKKGWNAPIKFAKYLKANP